MHINRLFTLLMSLLSYGLTFCQYSYKDVDRRMILVKTDDDIIEAAVYEGFKVKKIFPDRNYYWYDHSMIMSSKGGFTGELLHGAFSVQYRNYQIKEQGAFKYGLKQGIWKRWNPLGLPKEFITYKNGILNGNYTLYDTLGSIKEKGKYKKGLKHGRVIQYNGDDLKKLRFSKGIELTKKEKEIVAPKSNTGNDKKATPKDQSKNAANKKITLKKMNNQQTELQPNASLKNKDRKGKQDKSSSKEIKPAIK